MGRAIYFGCIMGAIAGNCVTLRLYSPHPQGGSHALKLLKKIVVTAIWVLLGLFMAIAIAMHVPAVQRWAGATVAEIVGKEIGARVEIGRVDIGLFNRVIIDRVKIDDQKGREMLTVARVAANIGLADLAAGRIRVSSAQLFGPRFFLVRETDSTAWNFQFIVDSLSKGDNKDKKPLDLQINSFIIRRGELSARQLSKAPRRDRLDMAGLQLSQISGHIVINQLTDSVLMAKLKRLSFHEKSGLSVDNLTLSLLADRQTARITGFDLRMPQSRLQSDGIAATYRMRGDKLEMPTLRYSGTLRSEGIALSDLAFLMPGLRGEQSRVRLAIDFSGTSTTLHAGRVEVASAGLIDLRMTGDIGRRGNGIDRFADIRRLEVECPRALQIARAATGKEISAPIVERLGLVAMTGNAHGAAEKFSARLDVSSAAGQFALAANKNGRHVEATIGTKQTDIGMLTANAKLGLIDGEAHIDGNIGSKATLTSDIRRIDLNGYSLQGLHAEASTQQLDAKNLRDMAVRLTIADPAVALQAEGLWHSDAAQGLSLHANVEQLCPRRLHLSDKWGDATFSFAIDAKADNPSVHGNWQVAVDNLVKSTQEGSFVLDRLRLKSSIDGGTQRLSMDSDFGYAELQGRIDFGSLKQSIVAIVADKLPTMPGLPAGPYSERNDFSFSIFLRSSQWAYALFGIPIDLDKPFEAAGELSDATGRVYMDLLAPSFSYDGSAYRNADVRISSPAGALTANVAIDKVMDSGKLFHWAVDAKAANNRVSGGIEFDNHSPRLIKGSLHADAGFALNLAGETAANIRIGRSHINFGDSLWTVEPSTIDYSKHNLRIADFAVRHNKQYITLSGTGTASESDTITARLKDVDISYIMNLIDFHSVDFDGFATGRATIAGLFAPQPKAETNIEVANFLFQKGRMGTLFAHAAYNNERQQIDIVAHCDDDDPLAPASEWAAPLRRRTLISGFVSPQRGDIELNFKADNTRLEFLGDICDSFLGRVDCIGRGDIRLGGTLKKLTLTGQAEVDGEIDVSSLGTTYKLHKAQARLLDDRIEFLADTLTDLRGRHGILTGAVFHQNLKRFTYDVSIDAHNLLAYDTHDFGEYSFYGTAYATGNCHIRGRSGEVNIDVSGKADDGSILVYNVTSPSELTERDFVVWHDSSSILPAGSENNDRRTDSDDDDEHFTTNLRFNFVVDVAPSSTLRLIMDPASGDYIDLNGSGSLRCQYYNKGSFDIYGNYLVDHGLYKLTVQNVLRRDFRFLNGGLIAFGGDPFAATLNLKAQYTLNGVSLSDLGLGNSFSSNNVRVDCLMNIGGTAGSPRVDFSLDMPTMNAEAKQMVYSLINSSDDLNNQVLYLLAVGRFYQQPSNGGAAGSNQQNQTSLAMQSILSGTISQQINTLLAGVTKDSNFRFGANISTGDEGFNNAEYEGLVSGQLLNNRLLFDGQFGYRDKANATSSFIGDFDIKYLLTPSGSIAVRVYNQSNDRYFTRSSLNTQGIGLILKHDFNKLFPLWKTKKKK